MEVLERRRRERERRIKVAEEFVKSLRLHPLTAIVIGSTARGDFNEWSDIDVVVISDRFPENPLKRFELLEDHLKPGVEPIPLRVKDLLRLIKKKAPVVEDMAKGVFIVDELGVKRLLRNKREKAPNPSKS